MSDEWGGGGGGGPPSIIAQGPRLSKSGAASDVTPTTTGYTAVSPTTAGTTPLSSSMTPSASGSGGLQFEPVSPGDEDGTPPLVTMEGVSTSTAQTHTHTVMLRVSYAPVLHVISVCGHNLIGYNFRLLSTIKMSAFMVCYSFHVQIMNFLPSYSVQTHTMYIQYIHCDVKYTVHVELFYSLKTSICLFCT